MSGSQPGGHELFGPCTSRVAFHVLSYPASSWAVPSDGGCTITLAAHTSCVAHIEPEQNRAFACSQKLPRPTYSRKHGARLRSLRTELLVAAVPQAAPRVLLIAPTWHRRSSKRPITSRPF